MAWYDKFINPLREELGARPWRLLSLVFEHAQQDPGERLTWRAGKAGVLENLAAEEGVEPAVGTVRARVHQINQAARAVRGGDAAFELRSRKGAFDIVLRESAEDELARREAGRLAEESSDADAIADAGQYIEPAVFTEPREFQIFVSHGHESPQVESVVRAFVKELDRKLRYPPARYKHLFRATLWLDHDRMGGARSFADQAHPECERSELGLFLLSEKFYQSEECRAEAAFFVNAPAAAGPHHMQVQLCGSFADAEAPFRDKPCYPQIWRSSVDNLLRAWELSLADRDEFLTRLRDDILADIARRNFPGGSNPTPPPGAKRGAEARTRSRREEIAAALVGSAGDTRFEDVIDRDKTEPPAVTREEGSGETESAVELLADWACANGASNRIFALLGSFGAGKTTASQLFVRELLRRREADPAGTPVPVYLDFRRLNELYLDERTRPSLAEMIRSSLRSNVKDRIDAEQLLAFLRREPCVVVFDGLDEIGTRIGLERLAGLYRELLEIVPNATWEKDAKSGEADWNACPTRILVTCRTHFFRTHLEQQSTLSDRDRHVALRGGRSGGLARTIYMAPFTPDQIRSYFGKELGVEEGERVWQSISRVADLTGLATRPIMARYIAELSPQLQDDLAQGRTINAARVYDHLFEKAVERDNDKKPLLKPRDRARLLEELAEELWRSRAPSLSIDALEDWFDHYCESAPGLRLVAASKPEARGLLQTELRNANLLVRSQDREFAFVHTSFQEYFLARKFKARLDSDALEAWTESRLPSNETLHFLLDLYAVDRSWPKLRSALERSLTRGRPVFWRRFAMAIRAEMSGRGQWFALPDGADLSGLDLRALEWPQQRLTRVDMTGTNLLAGKFTKVEFDRCALEGSNWSNTAVDSCSFRDCDGRPTGLASARFGGCAFEGGCDGNFDDLIFAAPTSDVRMNMEGCERRSDVRVFEASGGLNSATFRADDRLLLTAGHDGMARLWDAATGAELRRFEGHGDWVRSAVFGPDGRTILTAGDDGTARLWDVASEAELRRFEGHRDWVKSAVFAPDGRTILTAGDDGTARLWDWDSEAELLRIKVSDGGINSAVFSTDGRTILTAGDDGTARLWDAADGREVRRFEGQVGVRRAVFGADDRTVLMTGPAGTVVWDTASGTELYRLEEQDEAIVSSVFGADGRTILTAGEDGAIRMWDSATGTELRRLDGHQDWVASIVPSSDGRTILTAGDDGTTRLWDAATGTELRRFEEPSDGLTGAVFSADGRAILTSGEDGVVRLWDTATGTELRRFEEHDRMVAAAMLSPDGRTVLTRSAGGTVRLVETANGAELRRIRGPWWRGQERGIQSGRPNGPDRRE